METARIGTFIDTYETVKGLARYKKIPVHSLGLRQALHDVARRLDNEQPGGRETFEWEQIQFDDAGLLPFPGICALSPGFSDLARKLEEGPGETEIPEKWGERCYQTLQELIRRFQERYLQEVRNRVVFVHRVGELESAHYYQDKGWQADQEDANFFERLPRIAQTCFRDAARSLAYGQERPAISLAVQAVEATIRYCFRRLLPISPAKPEWHPMVEALHATTDPAGQPYITQVLKEDLLDLKESYRNPLSHGRAVQATVSPHTARQAFNRCWRLALDLLFEMKAHPEYRLLVQVHPAFTFDAAMAAYLFNSNLEIPDLGLNNPGAYHRFIFDAQGIKEGELYDQKAGRRLPEISGSNASLEVAKYLKTQEGYGKQITNLINFSSRRKEGHKEGLNPDHLNSFDLADLFYGHREMHRKEGESPNEFMQEIWKMFDLFVQKRSLAPEDDPKLIEGLGLIDTYRYICENQILKEK